MSSVLDSVTSESGETHTILLVEDQPAIRRYAARVLERAGCRVLSAADGREALALLDQHARSVELLLTDIALPDQSGYELAREARARWQDVRVLYATGSVPPDDGDPDAQRPAGPTLSKPYDPESLVRAVLDVFRDEPLTGHR